MTFHVRALDAADFQPLFALSDEALAARGGRRVTCDRPTGFPCRVSLRNAVPGEEVLLANFEHQPTASPFRSSHAIFVRRGVETAHLEDGEIPTSFRPATLSLRAFDADGMMRGADLVEGREVEPLIVRLFADPAVAYLHAHYAKPGCFAARIDRA